MNDLDPLLHEAMSSVRGPVNARPSLTDVRRRARRHNRRRMTATAGALACTGVATAALVIHRDSTGSATRGLASEPSEVADPTVPPTTNAPGLDAAPTSLAAAQVKLDAAFVWDALSNLQSDPSAAGFVHPGLALDRSSGEMPTAANFGCSTDQCSAMFSYVVWHEVATALGFSDVRQMQGMNPAINFANLPHEGDILQSVTSLVLEPATTTNQIDETPTTISLFDGVVLIDGGAPAGAMDDAFQRLTGYNRTSVPSSGKTVEQTELMPIGDNTAMATAVGGLLGLDGFDTWDPSFAAAPVQGMVAVVIGPDYFDRVASCTRCVTVPTSTVVG